jgi:colicin import membrane protein
MAQSSSVQFSLRELAEMEEERVRSAAQAEAREREAREQAARESEAREAADRAYRERAEELQRRELERTAREEAARIAAIHNAAVEAARATAAAKVRAEEHERDRLHALAVEQARAAARKTGPRSGVHWAALGAISTTCLCAALYLGVAAPRTEETIRSANAETAARDLEISSLRAEVAAASEHAASLQSDLASARAKMAQLRTELEAHPLIPVAHPPVHMRDNTGGPPSSKQLDGLTTCAPGSHDPLCLH